MSGGRPRTGASGEAVRLNFYFGEHDRHQGRSLAEAVLDLFARRELAAATLLRGAEGFGAGRRLQTDRLLSLSEDLPLLASAIDRRERIEATAAEVAAIAGDALLTLERVRLGAGEREALAEPHEEVKLTVYAGRRARHGGELAHVGIVAALHRHGVAGASALVAVDGAAAGRRLRARFLGGNGWVPSLIVAVGERGRIAAALAELAAEGDPPLATLERVDVCRRDGVEFAAPANWPVEAGADGPRVQLTVYCSERSEHRGRSLYMELIRRLRAAGAAGATALRGVWGYHGDHVPHGDRLLTLRRRVPIVLTVIDTPARSKRWLEIAAELTAESGLLTAETVPAARVSGPGGHLEGRLKLGPE